MKKHEFTNDQRNIIKVLLDMNTDALKLHTSKGNTKLNFFNFGLPAVLTCGDACKHNAACTGFCYALNSENRYSNVFKANYENLILFNKAADRFKALLVAALDKYYDSCVNAGKPAIVRLNESGDFINAAYARMIYNIACDMPYIKFYGYTKQYFSLDLVNDIPFYALDNVNLMLSKIENVDIPAKYNGLYNVAYTEKLTPDIVKLQNNGVIHCNGNCSKCHACIDKGHNVFFVIHGSGNYDYIPVDRSTLDKYDVKNPAADVTFYKTSSKTFQGIRNIYCKKVIGNNDYESRTINLLTVYKLFLSGKIRIYKNGFTLANR